MAFTVEQTQRLQQIQAIVIDNKLPKEEMIAVLKEGMAIMRGDRVSAQASSTASRTKTAAAKAVVNPSDLLANLKALGAKLSSGPVA